MRKPQFRPNIESLVLASLARGSAHGYEIAKRVADAGQGELKVGEGQLYPALHALEASGQVVAEWQPQEGKPARKVYSLTESGHAMFRKHEAEWQQFSRAVNAVFNRPMEAQNG